VRRTGPVDDRGESLIELLVALLIMGTTVVAVVGGLGTAIMMSDVHRKQATAAAYLNTYAANIESVVAASPTQYVACATSASYPSYNPGLPYHAEIVNPVRYWNGTNAFTTSCAPDTGVQRLTLHVWSTDGRADRSMDIVVRKPCRPIDWLPPPAVPACS
jgi:Tfp pilus assembly protein PilV